VIDRIFAADALIIGSPIYLGDITSQVHGLIERLHFCALSYDNYSNYFTGKVDVGIILTMNAPKAFYDLAYRKKAKEVAQSFKGLNGSVEVCACCDTLQVADYSKYSMASFNEDHKRAMREKQFPKDLAKAFELGAKLGAEK
jgi:multimeric flavodoxin WrbA